VFPIPRHYPEPDESRSSIALCKNPFNINLSSTPRSPTWSFFSVFRPRFRVSLVHAAHPSPFLLRDLITARACTHVSVKLCNRSLPDSYSCIDVPDFAHLCSYTNCIGGIQRLLGLPQAHFHYNEPDKYRSALYSSTLSSITMVEFIFRAHHNEENFSRKEAQTVNHNYIYIGLLFTTCFGFCENPLSGN